MLTQNWHLSVSVFGERTRLGCSPVRLAPDTLTWHIKNAFFYDGCIQAPALEGWRRSHVPFKKEIFGYFAARVSTARARRTAPEAGAFPKNKNAEIINKNQNLWT